MCYLLNFPNSRRSSLLEIRNITATNTPNNNQCKFNKPAMYVPKDPPAAPESSADQNSLRLFLVPLSMTFSFTSTVLMQSTFDKCAAKQIYKYPQEFLSNPDILWCHSLPQYKNSSQTTLSQNMLRGSMSPGLCTPDLPYFKLLTYSRV